MDSNKLIKQLNPISVFFSSHCVIDIKHGFQIPVEIKTLNPCDEY